MNILTTMVPEWISILFLITVPIPIFMIANVAKQGTLPAGLETTKAKLVFRSIVFFYAIYLTYVSIMSWNGVFSTNTLPPKIILFTTLPLFLFFLLVVSRLEIYKTILRNVSFESLVRVHIFRLIGIFFLILHAHGAIPREFAYIAGIGDIATAVSSIFVAKAITTKKPYAKVLTILWNTFGILDIVAVLVTAIITTKLSIETGSQNILALTYFPFCLIPSFAAATIIFLHVSLFRKLRLEK